MADKKSEVSRYKSKYTDGFITAAQLIAERICEIKARTEKLTLHQHFWNDPLWSSAFRQQLNLANGLISGKNKSGAKYEPSVILAVLASDALKYRKITSLGAMFALKPLLDAEQKQFDREQPAISKAAEDPLEVVLISPRPSIPKKNNLDKLKGL